MRKYMEEVLSAHAAGKRCERPSARTDGTSIWSYDTIIATRDDRGRLILNTTKYSLTTTSQQSAIRLAWRDEGYDRVTYIPMYVSRRDLLIHERDVEMATRAEAVTR